MKASGDMKDFEKFMGKVDQLQSIVKGLTSEDPDVQVEAIQKADRAIKKADPNKNIGFDRTVINKKAFEDEEDEKPSPMDFTAPQTDQNAFMRALEADANKRAKARRERHRRADVIKEKGNVYFKNGEYKDALKCYNEAIHVAKDKVSFYTNRAAVFMKLERFDEVIADCDFAIRVDEKWVKSYYFKARALQHLHKFNKAAKYFKKMAEFDKNKTKIVEGLLKENETNKKIHLREKEAEKLLGDGDNEDISDVKRIDKIIHSLRDREQKESFNVEDCCFFTGGIRFLETLCTDEQSRTCFRTQGGFELIFEEIKMIGNCIKSNITTDEQIELIVAVLCLLRSACTNLTENLRHIFRQQAVVEVFDRLSIFRNERIEQELLAFYHMASLSQDARLVLCDSSDICRTFKFILETTVNRHMSASTFHNFTIDGRFLKMLVASKDKSDVFDVFTIAMATSRNDEKVFDTCLKSILNLCENKQLSIDLSKQDKLTKALQNWIMAGASSSTFKSLLTIYYYMVKNNVEVDMDLFDYLTNNIDKNEDIPTKIEIIKLVSAVLESRAKFVVKLKERELLLKEIFKIVKKNENPALRTFALKIICLVSKEHVDKLSFLPRVDKKYKLLRQILALDGDGTNSIDQSHVALLLGNLSKVENLIAPLVHHDDLCSDVIRSLLVLCRDLPDKVSRVNCSISLAKLAKSHPRFLYHLRLNDGINILSKQDPREL